MEERKKGKIVWEEEGQKLLSDGGLANAMADWSPRQAASDRKDEEESSGELEEAI